MKNVRKLIEEATRPLYLFDDDPDGLSAFLILYRITKNGKGIALKGSQLDERMTDQVNMFSPDLVIVLDKAEVAQEFFDQVHARCIWIDHHEVKQPKGITYINPRIEGNNYPTSYLAWKIANQDEWLAVVGIVSDWQIPQKDLLEKFNKNYPEYKITEKNPEDALYKTEIGKLAKVFSFNLKGKDIYASIKMLSRIQHPRELLEKEHSQAKLLMKKYEKQRKEYEQILAEAKGNESPILLYTYNDNRNSYTTDISNELLFLHPDKLIIIGRNRGGSYKCSIRSKNFIIDKLIEETSHSCGGEGGGHEHACGAVIPEDRFEEFVQKITAHLEKLLKDNKKHK